MSSSAPVLDESDVADSLLIDARELARLLSVSAATLHRMKAAGKIGPRSLALSRGCVRWRRETVERWIAASEAEGRLLDRKTWEALAENTNGRRPR
jgi:predicted DNA-binding transcriptional regulator AlpA